MKVDILPNINRPTVSVFAEAEGYSAEEVEQLILTPLESAILGSPGVERVRGTASFGLAIVNVEFSWGSDIYRNRQIIQERITQVQLPEKIRPVLGPVDSIMGEIVWAGVTSESNAVRPMELRTLADWTIRPALLRVPGVSNVLVMGGEVREWQINLQPEQMRRYGMRIDDVVMEIREALTNKSGGILYQSGKEYPIRIITAPQRVDELGDLAIGMMDGRPVRLSDVAVVEEGTSPTIRGNASIDGKQGVIIRIIRQPEAETLTVTKAIDSTLAALQSNMPEGVTIQNDLFRQEWFIHDGLRNVLEALRDGTILVIFVLILFLMNFRVTAITLTAIPLSILATAIVFKYFGLSVNVMTLGGLAVAVGELVDDAIVDVENVYRKLREWRTTQGARESVMKVIFKASSEVRNSIVYATLLVAIVFLPVFFLPGVEGRLLGSLGTAYLVSLFASLLVSLTVTPVLASYLLIHASGPAHRDTRFVAFIKLRLRPLISWSIHHVKTVSGVAFCLLVAGAGLYFIAGKSGIPPFNESSATVVVNLPIGTDLLSSTAYASAVGREIQNIRGVKSVALITGRAGQDAHEWGSNQSEMQVVFESGMEKERTRLFTDIQEVLNRFKEAQFSLGQPITHRVETLLSGIPAPIVIKVYGDSQEEMQSVAQHLVDTMAREPGIKNPQIQKNVLTSEVRLSIDRTRLAEGGLSAGTVANELEMGLMGDVFGQVRLGAARVNVVARYDAASRGNTFGIRDLPLPYTGIDSLGNAAQIELQEGRNRISHEGGKRTLTVSANYQGSDIVGAVESVRSAMAHERLPSGISISYEGNYKSQKENSRRLMGLFFVGIVLIFALLYRAFHSFPLVFLVMANIPTVLIGGILAVWITGGIISLAHLVGFISLAGIVSRNGIMLIGRALQLVREGSEFHPDTITRATLDRVVPVLMTSLVTGLALIPLILAGGEPGKELLNPLASVIFGGLISSTLISLFLVPALFYRFGRRAALRGVSETGF